MRVILLVRGPTDDPGDDVLLELKELTDSGLDEGYPPGVFCDGNPDRVRGISRAVWAIPDADPLWGATSWVGLDCQIKTESDGEKSVRVKRLTGERGTPDAITGLASTSARSSRAFTPLRPARQLAGVPSPPPSAPTPPASPTSRPTSPMRTPAACSPTKRSSARPSPRSGRPSAFRSIRRTRPLRTSPPSTARLLMRAPE